MNQELQERTIITLKQLTSASSLALAMFKERAVDDWRVVKLRQTYNIACSTLKEINKTLSND